MKRKANWIGFLTNAEGGRVEDHNGMCEVVCDYFKKLFTEDTCITNIALSNSHRMLSEAQNSRLMEEFTFEEFIRALKQGL